MASEGVSHTHSIYAQLVGKAQNHEHESDLYELAQLAGVTMDPEVFKIVLDLLEMKCSPKTIADVLHSMLKHSTFNTTEQHDHSQADSSKNMSNQGPTSSHSTPSASSSASQIYGGGRSSCLDQSHLSNITIRSNSGDRRSQGSLPAASRAQSRHNSSSYLSRGEHKNRRNH